MATREVIVELKVEGPAFDQFAKLTQQQNTARESIRALKKELRELQPAAANFATETARINKELAKQDVIASNAGIQMRELRNNLNGATASGLRFRDKMAEASRAGLAEFGLQAASIAAVGAAVAGLTKELFVLAGEIEKVDARNRAIAQDSLPAFTRAAELSANAIGLTQREYVSLAADQALRLKQLGIEGDLLTELSIQTVEYADKLGDFSGGELSAEQAASLLNDALTGQTKGLKELGVNVKATKEEIAANAQELMRSKGLTEEQATAVATLQLAFRDTGDSVKVFGDQLLNLDAAQDSATARFNEAKEALAVGLTPVFEAATESAAEFADALARLLSSDGFFGKAEGFIDIINKLNPAGWAAGFLGKNVFADTEKGINDLATATAAYNAALLIGNDKLTEKAKANLDAVRALSGETLKAKAVQEEGTKATEEATGKTEESTKATVKKTDAVKKLTEAQLAQVDAENAIRGDASANIFAVTPTEPTEVGRAEEQIEEVTFQYAELNRLRTEFQGQQLEGIFDYNTQKALIEQEHRHGDLRDYADYQAALANLDNARLQQQLENARAISNIFGNLASIYDEASDEYKAFATIQTLINTYMSATAAFNSLASIPYVGPALGGIAAAAAVAAGLANVAKIQGFEEGGYTAKRSKNTEPVGVVHANEWVAPAWQTQHPDYAPTIKWLEQARKRRGLRSGIDGFFGGGVVNNVRFARGTGLATQTGSGTIAQADLSRALLNMPPPVVSVTEIREVSNRVSVVERMSRA